MICLCVFMNTIIHVLVSYNIAHKDPLQPYCTLNVN